jgi:hypothetical protein
MFSHHRLLARSLVVIALAVASCGAAAQTDKKPESAGPYVPTPWAIVDEIMKLAGIGPEDYVIDLGSGDGRLVITAASRYGARGGFGVDIDESLVKLANENAAKEGVDNKVRFVTRDLFVTSVGDATVVTLYLRASCRTTIPFPTGRTTGSSRWTFPKRSISPARRAPRSTSTRSPRASPAIGNLRCPPRSP